MVAEARPSLMTVLDGITAMYLAKVTGVLLVIGKVLGARSWKSSKCYPSLEAEYFLFFHLLYGMIPGLKIPEHEISTLQEDCERDKCQGFKSQSHQGIF